MASPGTPASSTTTTGREILLKVALNTKNQSINLPSQKFLIHLSLSFVK
jgi:hypothetical protein